MSIAKFMFSQEKFSERLKALRVQHGYSQGQVADSIGGTVAMISDMENGRRTTTIEKLDTLASFFHVSLDYLVGRTDNPEPPQ